MSFRARLLLGAFYVLTAVVLALEIPLALTIERRADSDFQNVVLGDAAILAARVSDLVPQADRPSGAAATRIRSIVSESAGARPQRIVVTDAQGLLVADSDGAARPGTFYATPERPEFREALFRGRIDTRRRFSDTLGEELLLVTVPAVDRERVVGAVRISASTAEIAAGVRSSWLRLAAVGVAVIVAGLILTWLLAVPLGRRIRRLADASARLGRGDLDVRAPEEEGPAELDTLARSFNQMATELTGSIEAQREFVANASHQLRTPLTGLRLRLEAIAQEGGRAAEQAAKAQAELDRLNALVNDLLALAHASSADATAGAVDLGRLAEEAVARWRDGAEAAGKRLQLRTDGRPVVWASREDVAHIFDNLIDNALRYAPEGSRVRVETGAADGQALLAVADDGPGIPPEERTHVFERFYRGSTGRGAGPGTGLGLAIVADLARRWDGDVRLADGAGTRVEAVFPRVPAES